jgi:hypothetical protein
VARLLNSGVLSFVLLAITNLTMAAVTAAALRGHGRHLELTATLFFLLLLTLIVTL